MTGIYYGGRYFKADHYNVGVACQSPINCTQ